MKKLNYLLSLFAVLAVLMSGMFVISCDDDEKTFESPTITLSKTTDTLRVGAKFEIDITIVAPGIFEKLVIRKKLDGVVKSTTNITASEITNGVYLFSDVLVEADVEGTVVYNFEVTDKQGKIFETELVVIVERTIEQILVRYDWDLVKEIRKLNNSNDISVSNADDVFRFDENFDYSIDYGAKLTGFEGLAKFCYWMLNTEKDSIFFINMGFNGATWVFDVKTIKAYKLVSITEGELRIQEDVSGMSVFNAPGDNIDPDYTDDETFTKVFTAVAKTDDFVPYGTVANVPTGECGERNLD